MTDTDPCVFCRLGSCAIHSVYRIVRDKRGVPADHEMLSVSCCDFLESAVFLGVIRKDVERAGGLAIVNKHGAMGIRHCPFCAEALHD